MQQQCTMVGIAAKLEQVEAQKLTLALIDWLRERHIEFRLDRDTAEKLGSASLAKELILSRETLVNVCRVIVVLGGDGTFISICRHAGEIPPTVIGINLGTLGFLTDITVSEMYSVIESALQGQAQLERRSLLSAAIETESAEVDRFQAVNDIVISKETLARIFSVEVFIDGSYAATLRGDGVIVATPGGSTAYSLSAGGSIVHPQVDAMLLTPICPHTLTSRPLVLPGCSVITLRTSDISNVGSVFLSIDGQQGRQLVEGEMVRISSSPHSFFFAKSPSKSYYEVLGTKLKWAAR